MTAATIYANNTRTTTTTISGQKGTQEICAKVKCQAAEQQSKPTTTTNPEAIKYTKTQNYIRALSAKPTKLNIN